MKRLFVVLGLVMLVACQKNPSTVMTNDTGKVFPEAVGTHWAYHVTDTTLYNFYPDSFTVAVDTVHIEIVRRSTSNDGTTEFIWQVDTPEGRDSVFVKMTSDTLVAIPTRHTHFTMAFTLVLPLDEGETWQDDFAAYQTTLVNRLDLPVGRINNVYAIRQQPILEGNIAGANWYYIKPGIGLVQYIYRVFITVVETNHRMTWRLMTYSIPH